MTEVKDLIKMLKDPAPAKRTDAAKRLAELGDDSAAEGLIKAVEGDKDAMVRFHSALALVRLERPEGVHGLVKYLIEAKASLRDGAREALLDVGSKPCLDALASHLGNRSLDTVLGDLIKKKGLECLPSLVDVVLDPDAEEYLLKNSVELMGDLLVRYEDWPEQADERFLETVNGVKRLKDKPRAVRALLSALGSQDKKVRQFVCRTFSEISDPTSIGPLTEVMKNDSFDLVRMEAAHALARQGDTKGLEQLVKFKSHESEGVSRRASTYVSGIGGSSYERIIKLMRTKDSGKKDTLHLRIATPEQVRSLELLLRTLESVEDVEVRRNCAEMLWDSKTCVPDVARLRRSYDKEEDPEVKDALANVIAFSLGDIPRLEEALQGEKDPWIVESIMDRLEEERGRR